MDPLLSWLSPKICDAFENVGLLYHASYLLKDYFDGINLCLSYGRTCKFIYNLEKKAKSVIISPSAVNCDYIYSDFHDPVTIVISFLMGPYLFEYWFNVGSFNPFASGVYPHGLTCGNIS